MHDAFEDTVYHLRRICSRNAHTWLQQVIVIVIAMAMMMAMALIAVTATVIMSVAVLHHQP
jgi:hypothetical protein